MKNALRRAWTLVVESLLHPTVESTIASDGKLISRGGKPYKPSEPK